MTKSQLVAEIAKKTDHTKIDTEAFVNATLEVIQEALVKGESIPLIGFGTFSITERSARTGRNPRTGDTIDIPASKSVKFSIGSKLKEAING